MSSLPAASVDVVLHQERLHTGDASVSKGVYNGALLNTWLSRVRPRSAAWTQQCLLLQAPKQGSDLTIISNFHHVPRQVCMMLCSPRPCNHYRKAIRPLVREVQGLCLWQCDLSWDPALLYAVLASHQCSLSHGNIRPWNRLRSMEAKKSRSRGHHLCKCIQVLRLGRAGQAAIVAVIVLARRR